MPSVLTTLEIDPAASEATSLQVEQFLRKKIRSGELSPGDRLPSTHKLAELWRVGPVSVQDAMARLQARGLIRRQRSRGTFVANTTDTVTIALLTSANLVDEQSYYARAMIRSLQEQMTQRGWGCQVLDAFTQRILESDNNLSNVYDRFLDDVRGRHINGFVEVSMGWDYFSALESDLHLPTVRISSVMQHSDVMTDFYAFGKESFNWLAQQGCRNILCFGVGEINGAAQGIDHAKIEHPEVLFQTQFLPTGYEKDREKKIYKQMLALIASWKDSDVIPDAMIVSDDVAMRAVALALIRKNIHVPQDMRVVTIANEGVELHYGIPVVRYEFSPQEKACCAIDLLWQKMCRDKLPRLPIFLQGKIVEERSA